MLKLSHHNQIQQKEVPFIQLKKVREWLGRKQKYEKNRVILGQRNSYSKTDYDATFMRMKDDYKARPEY